MWLPSEHYYPGYGYYLRVPRWLSGAFFRYVAGHVQVWAIKDAPVLDRSAKKSAIIMSHGLGGIRTTYSTLCCELASHGHVVAAVEHRDGSASITVDHAGKSVEYHFPGENNEYNFRSMQLAVRVDEVSAVVDFVKRRECREVLAGDNAILDKLVLGESTQMYGMGHSMGAATVLRCSSSGLFTAVIGLDPWTFPLPLDMPPVPCPALVLSLEFFDWPNNEARLRELMREQAKGSFLTILKAEHVDQCDVPLVMPAMIKAKFRKAGSVSPETVVALTNRMVVEFVESLTVPVVMEEEGLVKVIL
jgi:platelet-activating factor acetylhydrolase